MPIDSENPRESESPEAGRHILGPKGEIVARKSDAFEPKRDLEVWEKIGPINKASFISVKAINDLADRNVPVPADVLTDIRTRMEEIIVEAEKARIFAPEVFIDSIKRVDWGVDLYAQIALFGENMNAPAVRKNPEFDGVVPYVCEGAYSQLLYQGIMSKEVKGVDQGWRDLHGYDQDYIDSLKKDGEEKHGDILVKPGTENAVNYNAKKLKKEQDSYYGKDPDEADIRRQELELQREQVEDMKARNKVEKDYYEGARQDYEGFVSTVMYRVGFDPKMFDLNPPYWYNKLNGEQKGMIRTLINITNLASHIETYGMTDFQQVVGVLGIKLETKFIDHTFREMPGFSIAVATMVKDLFKPGIDHKDEKGNLVKGEDHFVLSDQGYKIIENFDEYKDKLALAIERYLKASVQNGDPLNLEKFKKDFYLRPDSEARVYEVAASAAVAAVDSLFYATGAYVSADEKRKLTNTKVWAEQPRAFFMPGVKGNKKWIKNEDLAKEFPGLIDPRDEEDWGGSLGHYLRERADHDKEFTKALENGDIRYLPDRLFFSLLEEEYFTWEESRKYLQTGLIADEKYAFNNRSNSTYVDFSNEYDELEEQIALAPSVEEKNKLKKKLKKSKEKIEKLVPGRQQVSIAEAFLQGGKYEIPREQRLADGLTGNPDVALDVDGVTMTIKLQDFSQNDIPGEHIDLSKLGRGELYGDYADTRSHAVPIYQHLTGKDEKSRQSTADFIEHVNKLRADDRLSQLIAVHKIEKKDTSGETIMDDEGEPVMDTVPVVNENGENLKVFKDPDLITIGVALAASPDGLVEGTSELILNLPDTSYDRKVVKALNEDRLYAGMPKGFRKDLLKRLNALDVTNAFNSLFTDVAGDTILSRRSVIRGNAKKFIEDQAKLVSEQNNL